MKTRLGLSMNDAVNYCSQHSTFFCYEAFSQSGNSGGDSAAVKLLANCPSGIYGDTE